MVLDKDKPLKLVALVHPQYTHKLDSTTLEYVFLTPTEFLKLKAMMSPKSSEERFWNRSGPMIVDESILPLIKNKRW